MWIVPAAAPMSAPGLEPRHRDTDALTQLTARAGIAIEVLATASEAILEQFVIKGRSRGQPWVNEVELRWPVMEIRAGAIAGPEEPYLVGGIGPGHDRRHAWLTSLRVIETDQSPRRVAPR